jgi:benzoylformate decarboxylase
VRYVFGNPGTTELPFIDALVDFPDIHYIWALQEASVVAMADGYAQASCRTGFVNLHTAGGLGHGFGSLWNASVSGTPLVVTAGQQDSRHALTDPLLSGDLVAMATPIVKWAKEATHTAQIPVLIRRAFHDSHTSPTGPVFVSLPMDIMEEMTEVSALEVSTIDRSAVAGSLDSLADHLAAIAPGSSLSSLAMRSLQHAPAQKWWNLRKRWGLPCTDRPGPRTFHSRPAIPSGLGTFPQGRTRSRRY